MKNNLRTVTQAEIDEGFDSLYTAGSTVNPCEDGYHLADPILAYHLSEHRTP